VLTRVPPRLPPELEAIVTATIGCAIRVHKTLGPGFKEAIYHDAMRIELTRSNISWRSDVAVDVLYEGEPCRRQYLDLVVDNIVVVEIKSVERLHPLHGSQILSYMKSARLPVGLLMNFNSTWLRGQIRRFVL
jgi:GxxExxY protein